MKIEPIFRKLEIINKGWGHEKVIANNDLYCGKLLIIKKNERMSGHFHLLKKETFLCYSGCVYFGFYNLDTADRLEGILNAGDVVDIPAGCPHYLLGYEDSVIVEISTHHEDSDSYRIEKGSSQKEKI